MYGDVFIFLYLNVSESSVTLSNLSFIIHFSLFCVDQHLCRDPGFARGAAVAKLKVQQEAPTKLA